MRALLALSVVLPCALAVTVITAVPGTMLLSSGSYYYGNDVKLRSYVVSSGEGVSWVDFNTMLPSGSLTRFFLHTFRLAWSPGDPTTVPVRLQIWRPVNMVQQQLRLVWEYHLLMPTTKASQGILITVEFNVTEQFAVQAGDRLGWTCETDYCPLCFTTGGDILISKNSPLPDINAAPIITFEADPNNNNYGQYSVAVEVIPTIVYGSPGSPGMPGGRGATGMAGATGAPGLMGSQGLPGVSQIGATGVRGPRGEQGMPGQPGSTGPAGPPGLNGSFVGPQGPEGPAGPPGPTGASAQDFEVTSSEYDSRLTAAIIGIVVTFAIVFILLLLAVIWLCCKTRNTKGDELLTKNSNLHYPPQVPQSYANYSYDENKTNQFALNDNKTTHNNTTQNNTFRSINNLKPMEYINNDDDNVKV